MQIEKPKIKEKTKFEVIHKLPLPPNLSLPPNLFRLQDKKLVKAFFESNLEFHEGCNERLLDVHKRFKDFIEENYPDKEKYKHLGKRKFKIILMKFMQENPESRVSEVKTTVGVVFQNLKLKTKSL